MKVAIYLTSVSLTSQGPRVDHQGASGASHPYLYSPEYQKHILGGKIFDAEELKKIAPEIFGAAPGVRFPVPMLVPGANDPPAANPAPIAAVPVSTVDTLFAAAAAMPKEQRRQLGFRLVNATRDRRKKKGAAA